MINGKKGFIERLNPILQLWPCFKDNSINRFRHHSDYMWKPPYEKTTSAFCTLLSASVLATVFALKPFDAQGVTLGGAVKISTVDPFAGCTADNKPAGTFYPDTETEPWIAV